MNKISNLFIGKLRQATTAAAATKHSDKQQIPTTSSKGLVSLYHYTPKKIDHALTFNRSCRLEIRSHP
jgi:hypothetical protein